MNVSFISVIVPFHNEQQYIEASITALLSQNYPRDCYEIIMVDSNSTDRSAEIVGRYPQIRLFREAKRGAYAARNRGVAECNGSIVALTDSDCAPDPDWLQRIAEAMAESKAQLVQGRTRFARDTPGLSVLSDYEAEKAAFTFSGHVAEIYYGYANNLAVRRSVFDRVGPFVEWQRGADVIFVQRIVAEYSVDAIRFSAGMSVRHLEVTSSWRWFRKMNVYGRSFRRYRTMANARPLNSRERLRVYWATVRHGRYNVGRSLLLFVWLAAGAVFYESGRLWPGRLDS